MIIRKAGLEDIDILIKLRIDYLSDERKIVMPPQEQEEFKQNFKIYLQKYMPDNSFFAYIAEVNGVAVSTAFLSVAERPPQSPYSSLTGTVYNVLTYPEYRRQGIATKIMTALMEEAQSLNIVNIDLLASNDGKYLYENLGFGLSKYTYMRKKLI